MIAPEIERLRSIKDLPTLIEYLRDELDWPIDESMAQEDMLFEYAPEEVGLDPASAVKIERIVRLRPLVSGQPWGIFYIDFKPGKLPITVLRRILRALVIRKRETSRDRQSWQLGDLLFLSTLGETESRHINLAHFSEDGDGTGRAVLRVVDWDEQDTHFHFLRNVDELHRLCWPDDPNDIQAWRDKWASAFALKPGEVITTSKQLAVEMARLARVIRSRVNAAMAIESESGPLRRMYAAFREVLLHDLKEDDFADMYAQTITYGLFAARRSRPTGITIENVRDMVPETNPFLRDLLAQFTEVSGLTESLDFDELGIDVLVDMLNRANMEAIVADFGDKNPMEDPVIHFYELFLKEYDARKKVQRGIFFTPRPVVSFIVRSVDELLRTEFGLEDGLADTTTWGEMRERHPDLKLPPGAAPNTPFVQILDPAVGTGTFLVEVIDLVFRTMRDKWQRAGHMPLELPQLWNEYVAKDLLPRLYGFELMMAPYAIAHMKVGLKLAETGYLFGSDERLRIYLTNTLEEPKDFSGQFETMAPALAHEAAAANGVKRMTPLTVVVGNPPYSVAAGGGTPMLTLLMRDYAEGLGVEEERKKGALQDDYVRFVRYSHWLVQRTGWGIAGLITNNSYLDGTVHRAMRHSLLTDFQKVRIVNLHGSGRAYVPDGGEDQNVFDILQGVSILMLARTGAAQSELGSCEYASLAGRREDKHQRLVRSEISFSPIHPREPYYLLRPLGQDLFEVYRKYLGIRDMFVINSSGIETEKDKFATDFEMESLRRRLNGFIDESLTDTQAAQRFQLSDTPNWDLNTARRTLRITGLQKSLFVRYLFHAFDWRFTYYSSTIITRPRRPVMEHMLRPNLALVVLRQIKGEEFAHALATASVSNKFTLSSKSSNVSYHFPLYVYEAPSWAREQTLPGPLRSTNFARPFVDRVVALLNLNFASQDRGDFVSTVGAEDIFHYVYAILYAPSYRTLYSDYLRLDFPRIPLTSDREFFRILCAFGADLVAFHLLADDYPGASWNVPGAKMKSPPKLPVAKFAGKGEAGVAMGYPKYEDDSVFINPSRWLEGVPEAVWSFRVGGYQVCEKWLKDRRGRVLSDEDIAHYQRIVVALDETIRLMGEIDEVIEAHGGWPDAFRSVAADRTP